MRHQGNNTGSADSSDRVRYREEFVSAYHSLYVPVCGYVTRRLSNPDDAADVIAETFLVLWRRFGEAPSGDDLRPWVYGVARRTMANHRRSEARRAAAATRLRVELNGMAQIDALSRVGVDDELIGALHSLSDSDREALFLVAWEGLSRKQVAVALGVSEPTARVRLLRARRRLERALKSSATSKSTVACKQLSATVPLTAKGV